MAILYIILTLEVDEVIPKGVIKLRALAGVDFVIVNYCGD